MKLTFLTCVILLSIGVVKAYDIIVAMTNGGPGNASYVPGYFVVYAYWQKQNLGYAAAAATIMLHRCRGVLPALPALHRAGREEGRRMTPAGARCCASRARRRTAAEGT